MKFLEYACFKSKHIFLIRMFAERKKCLVTKEYFKKIKILSLKKSKIVTIKITKACTQVKHYNMLSTLEYHIIQVV